MRKIVARGIEVGGGWKNVTIVYSHVSTSALAYSSLYAIKSKEMEAFDWLKRVGTVPSCLIHVK